MGVAGTQLNTNGGLEAGWDGMLEVPAVKRFFKLKINLSFPGKNILKQ